MPHIASDRPVMSRIAGLAALALANCTGAIGGGSEAGGDLPGMTAAGGNAPGAPASTGGSPVASGSLPAVPGVMPGTPAIPMGATPGTLTDPIAPILCDAATGPGATPVRRLSRREYINTLVRVVNNAGVIGYDPYETLGGKLGPLTPMAPPDLRDKDRDFSTHDQSVASGHMDGYFMLGAAAAQELAADLNQLKRYAPCAAAPDRACIETFVAKFGLRALRRPLTPDEIQEYRAIYDENAATPREGFEAVIEAFFLAPQFLYQLELEGTPVAGRGDLLRITDFEVASRLSYKLTWNMPSDELLGAASAGKLSDDAEYRKWVDKLFTLPTSATKPGDRLFYGYMSEVGRAIDRFYVEWLDIKTPSFAGTGAFGKFIHEGGWMTLAWDVAGSAPFIAEEMRDFAYRLTWLDKATVGDLYTNDGVIVNGRTRTFYNLPAGSPEGQVVPLPKHAGLLTRGGFLATGNETSMPIQRGVKIRRKLLCDDLPDPDPDALPDRSLVAPETSPTKSTRDRFAEKTAPAPCQACHALINPLGFALEDFDSLARHRTQEPIYEEKLVGKNTSVSRVGTPAVNAAVASLGITPGDNVAVSGGLELSRALGRSPKTTECYARQAFRFMNARREMADDSCVLKAMVDALAPGKGSLADMWRSVPLQPEFRLKRLAK